MSKEIECEEEYNPDNNPDYDPSENIKDREYPIWLKKSPVVKRKINMPKSEIKTTDKAIAVINDLSSELEERCKKKQGCEIVMTICITPEGVVGTAHKEIKRVRVI